MRPARSSGRAPCGGADRLAGAVGHLGPGRTTTLVHGLRALSRALRAAEDVDGPEQRPPAGR